MIFGAVCCVSGDVKEVGSKVDGVDGDIKKLGLTNNSLEGKDYEIGK